MEMQKKRMLYKKPMNRNIRHESCMERESARGEGVHRRCFASECPTKRKKILNKKYLSPTNRTETSNKEENTTYSSEYSDQTEFDVWARSLAIQLNNMETRRALNLQLQIQILISNDRLAYEHYMSQIKPMPSYKLLKSNFQPRRSAKCHTSCNKRRLSYKNEKNTAPKKNKENLQISEDSDDSDKKEESDKLPQSKLHIVLSDDSSNCTLNNSQCQNENE